MTSKMTQGHAPNYPIIGDADFQVSKLYGMLPADAEGDPKTHSQQITRRSAMFTSLVRTKKLQLILVYPMTTGRNFDEVSPVIDSLQLTAKHQVATPAELEAGEESSLRAQSPMRKHKRRYPNGWKAPQAVYPDRSAATIDQHSAEGRLAILGTLFGG